MQKVTFYQILILILLNISSYGMGTKSCAGYGRCRIAYQGSNAVKNFDERLLNIKPVQSQANSLAKPQTQPISITQTQFQSLASAGNSWMRFATNNDHITMNIGIADNINSQTWTLPSNIYTVFEYYERSDFISLASLPNNLDAPVGTTNIIKIPILDYDGAEVENYQYYSIDGTDIEFLGEDYDFDSKTDEDYDIEPDFKFVNVPLALNDNYSSTTERYDTRYDGSLKKEVNSVTVDGFGTIATPEGTFECLRVKYLVNTHIRANINDPFPVSPTSSYTRLQWIAANGYLFEGIIVSENTTTHEATLSDLSLNKIVSTSSLTETSDVKLNNDSKGVTINSYSEPADASAILDVKSENKGILIPRVTQANLPVNPAVGLLVYQTDSGAGFYYYDGSNWLKLQTGGGPVAPIGGKVATNEIKSTNDQQGTSQLQNGTSFIKFNRIREDFEKLQLNIQLEGDCNGVYISKKAKEGFEITELKKGKSNVKFSWYLNE